MSTTVIAFLNNTGGGGKTSLVYHLSWMYADLGVRVVAADLDPQSNLSSTFLDEDRLAQLWPDSEHRETVFGAVQPLLRGIGDVRTPHLEPIEDEDQLALLVGDLALSGFEDQLSEVWPKCLDRDERAFRVMSAFWRIMQQAADLHHASVVLVDVGPNLGALNRAALIAADYVVIPLAPDLFSLQGLRNLGPRLQEWRTGWQERLEKKPPGAEFALPSGAMKPAGYIVSQHSVRLDRPMQAYDLWIAHIPTVYRNFVLDQTGDSEVAVDADPNSLALLHSYLSLMPLAQEAHKPMFHLKPADGAIGSHIRAVQRVREDFRELAQAIALRTGVPVPEPVGHGL